MSNWPQCKTISRDCQLHPTNNTDDFGNITGSFSDRLDQITKYKALHNLIIICMHPIICKAANRYIPVLRQ